MKIGNATPIKASPLIWAAYALLTIGAFTPSSAYATATATASLVVQRVTIVDTRSGRLKPGMDVVVRGDKIVKIAKAGGAIPAGAQVIDGHGKFIVPGYNDMHAHPLNDLGPAFDHSNALMLANGITGYRQMSGTPQLLRARREGKFAANTNAPALLFMPGEIFTRLNAPTVEAAIAEVDRQKAEGADFIKVIDVTPPVFFAIGKEAKRVGLTYLGHLPSGVDPVEASAAGFRSIEHLGPNANMILACSTDEDAIKLDIANRPTRGLPPMPKGMSPDALQKVFEKIASAPLLITAGDPATFALFRRVSETYDDAKCRRMARAFIQNGTWQSPTLIRVKTTLFPDDPQSMNDPNLRYEDGQRRALWVELARRYAATVTPPNRAVIEQFWKTQLKMLKVFDETGVAMIAGTDLGGQWDIAGFSLHQDFDLLAEDGIAPLKVLQMTTLNAARFLGREATMGSVGIGKNADLVLLDANPIASVGNLHRINAVVRAGRYYSASDLEAMKARVAEEVSKSAPLGSAAALAPEPD